MNAALKRRIVWLEEVAWQTKPPSAGAGDGPTLDALSDEELDQLIDDLESGREIDPALFQGFYLESIAPNATEADLDNLIKNLRIANNIHRAAHSLLN